LSVLVLSHDQDAHGNIVIAALRARDVAVSRVSGADFPILDTASIHLKSGQGEAFIETAAGAVIDLSAVTAVWRRRGERPRIDANAMHPDDREFAHAEAEAAANGVRDVSALLNDAAWINPRRNALQAQNKPYQLAHAIRTRLDIPDTLISNAPDEVQSFYHAHAQSVIYKPLTPGVWNEGGESLAYFVEKLTEDAVSDDALLKLTPGIYQAYIDKAFELRVTIMDRFVHAVKIDSQALKASETDWRQSIDQLKIEPFELPQELIEKLLNLMTALGLRFGAVDLIVTPDNQYVFLEVNEMGQFLWIDKFLPEAGLLSHFCAFLCCADRPYAGSPGRFENLKFADYE